MPFSSIISLIDSYLNPERNPLFVASPAFSGKRNDGNTNIKMSNMANA
jgi:hypothetical protein